MKNLGRYNEFCREKHLLTNKDDPNGFFCFEQGIIRKNVDSIKHKLLRIRFSKLELSQRSWAREIYIIRVNCIETEVIRQIYL